MCKKCRYVLNEKLDSWPWVSPMWLNNLSHTKHFPLHRVFFEPYLQRSSFPAPLHLITEPHVMTFKRSHNPTCNKSSCDDVDARFVSDVVKKPKNYNVVVLTPIKNELGFRFQVNFFLQISASRPLLAYSFPLLLLGFKQSDVPEMFSLLAYREHFRLNLERSVEMRKSAVVSRTVSDGTMHVDNKSTLESWERMLNLGELTDSCMCGLKDTLGLPGESWSDM